MRALPLLFVLPFLLVACGGHPAGDASSTKAGPGRFAFAPMPGAADVFRIRPLDEAPVGRSEPVDPAACRAHIAEVVCLASDTSATGCAPGGEVYAKPFEELFDHYPPALQRMFCSLQKLLVLDKFYGTAFAGLVQDDAGHVTGAQMGIRRSVLDEHLSLQTWATWKEELSFGGVTGAYVATPGLPGVATKTDAPVNDFLYFVVTHEFGHMFDFANGLNKTTKAGESAPEVFTAESWGAHSWSDTETVKEEERFPYRKGLCFYGCDGEPMSRAAAPEVYRGLAQANFISTYAASNPWDDLADSLAYYMMDLNLGTSYELRSGQGESYDIMMKLHSGLFATKRQYIADFLARPAIVYP